MRKKIVLVVEEEMEGKIEHVSADKNIAIDSIQYSYSFCNFKLAKG